MTEQTRRASRLLEIERLLRRRPIGMTSTELAQELGYSARTIQRDLQVLESELRVPLEVYGRRYRIMAGSHPLAPVRLTLQEARALLVACRLLFRFSDEHEPDGIAAFKKLADSLPEHVAAQLEATIELLANRPQNREHTDAVRKLTEAWSMSRTASFEYRSQGSAEWKPSEVDPYVLEPHEAGSLYIIGYSHRHNAVRTFKVDRMRRVEVTDRPFESNPAAVRGVIDQLASSWGVFFGEGTHECVVEFTAEVADRVRESVWHPSQQLIDLEDGGVRLEVQLPDLREFASWVRSWGEAAFVLNPADLREQVAASLRAAAERYA